MKKPLKPIELTLAGMFVALMAIGANITTFVPFMMIGGVPITLQTFFAILAGAILGKRVGALSMTAYALVGLVGVPVFARFGAGLSSIVSPTFGFIVSFIFTAYITGRLLEKHRGIKAYIFAALVGMAVNYVFGTNWMYAVYKLWAAAPEGFTYKLTWVWMMVPLPKDIILAVCAGVMAHRLENTVLSKSTFRNIKRTA